MPRSVLAFCLLLPLALSAVMQPSSAGLADAPSSTQRDVVVPEGIEGLSADELFELALLAGQQGDVARSMRLHFAAARAGHLTAALAIVRGRFQAEAPDWPEVAVELLLPLADDARADGEPFFWLALAGEATDPPYTPEQVDLWYRLAAWTFVFPGRIVRADLQRRLDFAADEWFGMGAVPWRLREAVGAAIELRRAEGATVYGESRRFCGAPLQQAERLCLAYLEAAAEKLYPDAAYDWGVHVLDAPDGTYDNITRERAPRFLCKAGQAGRFEATIRLAHEILNGTPAARDFSADVFIQLQSGGSAKPGIEALLERLQPILTRLDLYLIERAERGSRLRC